MIRKRHADSVVVAALLAAAAAVLLWRAHGQSEPIYQGKPLSYWVDQLDLGYRGPIEGAEAAVQAIGPKATPFLLARLRQEHSLGHRVLRRIATVTWWPAPVKRMLPGPTRHLGLGGKTDYFLRLLGPAVVPYLVPALNDPNDVVRRVAVSCAGLAPETRGVTPALIGRLHDSDPEIRRMAVQILGQRGNELAVPALTSLLSEHQTPARRWVDLRSDAARALGEIGSPAAQAVPDLTRLLAESDPAIRQAAALALWKISRDKTGIPILMDGLDEANDAITATTILGQLAEIGPAARSAIPALLRLIDRAGRLQKGGLIDIRSSALQVLARIEPAAAIRIQMEELKSALLNKNPEDYDRCLRALRDFGGMGEAGRPVLKVILEVADNPGAAWTEPERTGIQQAAVQASQAIAGQESPSAAR